MDGRWLDYCTISSPCEPSAQVTELKKTLPEIFSHVQLLGTVSLKMFMKIFANIQKFLAYYNSLQQALKIARVYNRY